MERKYIIHLDVVVEAGYIPSLDDRDDGDNADDGDDGFPTSFRTSSVLPPLFAVRRTSSPRPQFLCLIASSVARTRLQT